MLTTEVLIIGGGPSGSACAWMLKRNGIECVIIDRAKFPRDKLCAGWVTPEVFDHLEVSPSDYPYGIIQLKKLHVTLYGIRFPVPTLQYSIRRYEFDYWLLQRANVPVVHHTVTKIRQNGEWFVVDDMYQSKYVVGAGGTYCPVHRSFFKEFASRKDIDCIVTQEEEFPYTYRDEKCYLWFMENKLPGYAWYVPKANGYLNIGVGGKAMSLRKTRDTIKRHWDFLIEKLRDRGLLDGYTPRPKGHCYYLNGGAPRVRFGNVFLVGDSAGLATVDMGEGIGPAIQSGIRAAHAIANGTTYEVDDISRRSMKLKCLRFKS